MSETRHRKQIRRWVGYCGWLLAAAAAYVLLDFSVDFRPSQIHSSYRFKVPDLVPNKPVIMRQDNFSIVVILRAQPAEYFVAYAQGTDLGCPLQAIGDRLKETCGTASYDFSGQALTETGNYQNLHVPEHEFSSDFKVLTVWP